MPLIHQANVHSSFAPIHSTGYPQTPSVSPLSGFSCGSFPPAPQSPCCPGLCHLIPDEDESLSTLVPLLLLMLSLQPGPRHEAARVNFGKCKPFLNTHSSRVKDQNLQPGLWAFVVPPPPVPLSSLSLHCGPELQLHSAPGTICAPCDVGGLYVPSSASSLLNILQTPARLRTQTLEPTASSNSAICQPWDLERIIH